MVGIPKLTAAEKKLKACAAKGEDAVYLVKDKKTKEFDLDDPRNDPANGAKWPKSRTISAKFLRRLLVDPPKSWSVHAKGVRILGARITGELDLEGTNIKCHLFLVFCHVEQPISLQGAKTKSLIFRGSHIPSINGQLIKVSGNVILESVTSTKGGVSLIGTAISGQLNCGGATFENDEPGGFALHAQNITVKGGVFLQNGFSAKGGVSFSSAKIGVQLNCEGAMFENDKPEGFALNAQDIAVKGGFFLREGFSAKGEIRLSGAKIGGQFNCDGSSFENDEPEGFALNAEGAKVMGDIFLTNGFSAMGGVSLSGAKIGDQLNCVDATFENKKPKGFAFLIQDARVTGGFIWRPTQTPDGGINFQHSRTGPLADNKTGWPEQGKLFLDGFEYSALAPGAPQTAVERLDWLRRQKTDQGKFTPQPYEQLIKVFRQMGHTRDARDVGFAKHEDFRLNGCCISRREWLWNWTLGVTIGHGYKPWITLYWMLAVVLAGWLVFTNAETLKAIHPSKEIVLLDPRYINSGGQWRPDDYPKFNAFIYSLDVFLPIVDLHQEAYWLPGKQEQALFWGWGYKVWLWLEILLGWFLTTIAVAGLTGIVKKD